LKRAVFGGIRHVLLRVLCIPALLASAVYAEEPVTPFTLAEVVAYGLKHSAGVRSAQADVGVESAGLRSAQAEKMPKLDLSGGVTKYKFPTPITPIFGTPPADIHFPEFDTTIYDAGLSFSLPLYRGGRLDRAVAIAELRKFIAEDLYRASSQELVYNLTSTFFKILQLEKFLRSNEETVRQLEAHRGNVEIGLKAGTAAKIDLLKTETELAHARQAALIAGNNVASAHEFLKTLMGFEDANRKITLVETAAAGGVVPSIDESIAAALSNRPDYQATLKRVMLSEERIALAEGRRLPSLNMVSEYTEKSGSDIDFERNWLLGLRLSVPVFEGGAISADVSRARFELEKTREEERLLRLSIVREVRDAHLGIENTGMRIDVAEKAIESAKENVRVEQLRYQAGAGTSTDVLDAQTALLRAETDYYQALYDRAIAEALLRKAVGEEWRGE
jgi:outer membrane protein